MVMAATDHGVAKQWKIVRSIWFINHLNNSNVEVSGDWLVPVLKLSMYSEIDSLT